MTSINANQASRKNQWQSELKIVSRRISKDRSNKADRQQQDWRGLRETDKTDQTEETEETEETEGPRERDPVGFWEHLGYRPTGAPLAALDRSVEYPARTFLRELVPVVPEPRAGLHHLELWTAALAVTAPSWHWMLTTLGWTAEPVPGWDTGRIWRHDDGSYLVLEQSPDTLGRRSERRGPGMNHVAFTVRSRAELDALRAEAPAHGWTELFSGAYPHAGGPDHTAWYGEDPEGIEVELVAAVVPAAAPDGAAEDSSRS